VLKHNEEEQEEKRMAKPIKKFRAGAIDASVWENKLEKGGREFEVFSVGIERRYKDKNEEWKGTNSFKVNDLPKVMLVAQKAYEFLSLKEGTERIEAVEEIRIEG
jgi:hypothetical protein